MKATLVPTWGNSELARVTSPSGARVTPLLNLDCTTAFKARTPCSDASVGEALGRNWKAGCIGTVALIPVLWRQGSPGWRTRLLIMPMRGSPGLAPQLLFTQVRIRLEAKLVEKPTDCVTELEATRLARVCVAAKLPFFIAETAKLGVSVVARLADKTSVSLISFPLALH